MSVREFVVPVRPEALLHAADTQFRVKKPPALDSLPQKELNQLLDKIVSDFEEDPTQICTNSNFDPLFAFLSSYHTLNLALRQHVFRTIDEGAGALVTLIARQQKDGLLQQPLEEWDEEKQSVARLTNSLKMYAFLMQWFASINEKEDKEAPPVARGRGRGATKTKKPAENEDEKKQQAWNGSTKEKLLSRMINLLELDVSHFWDCGSSLPEDYLNLFTRTALEMLENANNAKNATISHAIFLLLSILVSKHSQGKGVASALIHLLHKAASEHLASPIAQFLAQFVKTASPSSSGQIVLEVLREVGRLEPEDLAHNLDGARNIGNFLVQLAEVAPSSVLSNISLLVSHLDGESYMMRNGIVTLLSRLIALLPNDAVMPTRQAAEDDDEEEKEVEEEAQEDETKEEQGEDEEIVEEERDSEEEKMEKKPKQAERTKKERERKQTKEELNRSAKEVMLEILDRRFLDVSSYTRSKVLQAWCYLMENRAVPIHVIPTLAERVTERLTDKAVQVRKNALQLFVLLLTFNPYGPSLRLASFRQRLDRCLKGTEQEADQQKQEKKRTFLSSAQAFILHVHRAVELVSTHLLGSRTATDVIEAIHFLVCCAEFGVENAQAMGVRKMLMLIWSKDAQVRQALMDAYVRLYFSSFSAQEGDDSNKDEGQWLESLRKKAKLKNLNKTKANALCIAGRLIGLTIGANLAELTSLEEMIKELTAQKLISKDVIDMLCDIFSLEIDSVSAEESRNALLILSMTANANPDIIRSNLNLIVAVGLGPRSEEDELLGRFACLALQKLKHQQQQRLPNEHPLFAKLQRFVLSSLSRANHQNWYSAAEQAINTIFVLAQRPDQVCVSILNGLYKPLHQVINNNADDEDENNDEEDKEDKEENEDGFSNGDLSKLLFVLGHVALKMLVYMEEVYAQLSRERHQAKEDLARQKEEEAKNKRHNKKTVKRKTQKRGRGKKHVEDDEDDEEMGEEKEDGKTEEQEAAQAELEMAAGAVREEQESEWMHQLTEHHLVCDAESLLGAFAPLVVHVCLDPKQQFSANLLKSSAVLALCKFMCISSKFCEQHLQLLFTLHQKAEDASIRANISIALGDLALRFPNLLEPWTSHIYAALRDPSTKVRRNTLMVLTHLILNDMLKVKGNIAAMAQCLLDPDERTNQLAHLFFHELAQKGQSIYNILPDVLSHLSASEDVSSQDLRTIMNYLLSFIQKEKQTESLVMKLCHRFTTICCAGGMRQKQQCEDIAHCLEQLNYNDKSIRKLVELQKLWAPALRYPVVHQHFLGIVSKAKKFAKAEQKTAAEELESRMEEIRKKLKGDGELEVEEGEDDEADAEEDIGEQENMKKVEPTRRRNARKRGQRKEGQKTSRRGKKAPSYIDSDEEEGEEENYGDDSEDERKEQEAEELLQDLSENEEEEEEEEAKEEEEKVQESEDEPITERKRNVHTKLRKTAATIDPEEEEKEEKEEKEAIVLKQKKPVKRTAKRTAKRITTKKTATARVISKTTKPPVRKARRAAKKQRAEELVVSSEEEEEEPKTQQPQYKTRQVKKKKVIYGEETDDDDYED